MLNDATVMAMAAVKDIDDGKKFYGQILGLTQSEENMAGVMYVSGQGKIFVYQSPMAGTNQATTATWEVPDIQSTIQDLKAKGVNQWEHYEYPGAEHDGEVHIMGPAKAAWFRDPSGNILGLSQMS